MFSFVRSTKGQLLAAGTMALAVMLIAMWLVARVEAAPLATTSVTPASLVAGATGNVTVDFTSVSAVPTTGDIEIEFPAGFNVSGAGLVSSSNIAATVSVSAAGQIVTVASDAAGDIIAASTAAQVVLSGITNPQTAGTTGTFPDRDL